MTEQIINIWLDDIKQDLIKNYDKLGLRASGKWAASLETFYSETKTGHKFGIKGEDYTYYLENGRLPNKDQSPEALKKWVGWAGSTILAQWVKDKQININPYAVAWKIAREGIKVPNANNTGGLVSDVVTKEKINELIKELSLFKITELKSNILKSFK